MTFSANDTQAIPDTRTRQLSQQQYQTGDKPDKSSQQYSVTLTNSRNTDTVFLD